MIKITTKRDELHDEALREEGREQQRREDSREALKFLWKRETVPVSAAESIRVHALRPGDCIFRSEGIRGGYRGEEIYYVSDHYPDREGDSSHNGQPCREGSYWIEYGGALDRGVRSSGGSLVDADAFVLIVARDYDETDNHRPRFECPECQKKSDELRGTGKVDG